MFAIHPLAFRAIFRFTSPFLVWLLSALLLGSLPVQGQVEYARRMDRLNAETISQMRKMNPSGARQAAEVACQNVQSQTYPRGGAVAFLRRAQIARYWDQDMRQTEIWAKRSLGFFEESSPQTGLDTLYGLLFDAAFAQGHFSEALDDANLLNRFSLKSDHIDGVFEALVRIFSVYRELGDFENSFTYAQKLQGIAQQSGKANWLYQSAWVFGQLYRQIEDNRDALNYFQEARAHREPAGADPSLGDGNRSEFYLQQGELFGQVYQFDSAWYFFRALRTDTVRMRSAFLISTGECLLTQSRFAQAKANFQEAVRLLHQQGNLNEESRGWVDLAKAHLALGSLDTAIRTAHLGLALAEQGPIRQRMRDAYAVIFTSFDRKSRIDSSNEYFRKYNSLKEAILSDQTKAKFTANTYEQKMERVQQETLLEQRQQAWVRRLLVGAIAVLFVIASLVLRSISLQRKNEARRRELAENALRIQQLEAEKTRSDLLIQKADLEMRALQAQMNPHFIFNCLNSINQFIIGREAAKAADYLTKFARLIRRVLEQSAQPSTSLEEEIGTLELYMDLEKLRFASPFQYRIRTEGIDPAQIHVPGLLIQPFVENAIWHGLHPSGREDGWIHIDFQQQGNILLCKIQDNGVGRSAAVHPTSSANEGRKSWGIALTRQRLRLAGAADLDLVIRDLYVGDPTFPGTEVQLRVPLQESWSNTDDDPSHSR